MQNVTLITILATSRRMVASCPAIELLRWVEDARSGIDKDLETDTKWREMHPNSASCHNPEGAGTKLLLCNMSILPLPCILPALGSVKEVRNTFLKKLFYL